MKELSLKMKSKETWAIALALRELAETIMLTDDTNGLGDTYICEEIVEFDWEIDHGGDERD